ncbi:DUF4249 family protein [Chitinophaga horti]|uniref:DUF4249 family protein n=1 Tax=Chitinophaga horti TaxID=2920382 RepID=A0ABY6J7M6_9BACT|nr:DUF4249 domain-containing protein [Chitinophaga horti]UYQ94286.1 DUF4249 family protein [Chitinophaga horti]
MKKIFSQLMIAGAFLLTACETKFDLDVPAGKTIPVVDAWITSAPGVQQIRITETTAYTGTAPANVISAANVTLTDLTSGNVYPFTYSNGYYSFDPGAAVSIGILGHAYKLRVELAGQAYEAIDTVKRVPVIDSLTYEFKEAEFGNEEGYFAKLHARDLEGGNDYYWVRSYRNNKETRLTDNFPINGSFAEDVSDGIKFIPPISEGITRGDKPFLKGEKVIVRIASCTKASHEWLSHVESQIYNGGLFARVLENVGTNLKNASGGNGRVLGWFGMSGVSYAEKEIH